MARKTTAKSTKTASRRTATKRAGKTTAKRSAKTVAKRPTKKSSAKTKKVKVDPITLQVIGGALHTAAREMGHVLYRMSFSSIIRESEDLGAGLFDADYQTLSESDSTPLVTNINSQPFWTIAVNLEEITASFAAIF